MIALVLAALALHRSRRETLSGLAWALAALVKWVPLAFLALVIVGGHGRQERRLLAWSAGWLASLAVTATAVRHGVAVQPNLSSQAAGQLDRPLRLARRSRSFAPTHGGRHQFTPLAQPHGSLFRHGEDVRVGLAGVLLAALQDG
jgi:hypothetical protein